MKKNTLKTVISTMASVALLMTNAACSTTSGSAAPADYDASAILVPDNIYERISIVGGQGVTYGAQERLEKGVKEYQARRYIEAGVTFESPVDSYTSPDPRFAIDLKTAAALAYLSGGAQGDFSRVAEELGAMVTKDRFSTRETQFVLALNGAITRKRPVSLGKGVDSVMVMTVNNLV